MSPSGTTSDCLDILLHGFGQNVLDHPPTQLDRLEKIDLSAENLREFVLRPEERQPSRLCIGPQLHEHIHIAPLRIEVISNDGPEEQEPLDAPLPAERGD